MARVCWQYLQKSSKLRKPMSTAYRRGFRLIGEAERPVLKQLGRIVDPFDRQPLSPQKVDQADGAYRDEKATWFL
jgi:hypothetical protein